MRLIDTTIADTMSDLVLITTKEQLRKCCNKYDMDVPSSWPDGWLPIGVKACVLDFVPHGKRNYPVYAMCIPKELPWNTATLAAIVHECVHIYQLVMKNWGETVIGDETEAYFIQNIFERVYRAYGQETNRPGYRARVKRRATTRPRKRRV